MANPMFKCLLIASFSASALCGAVPASAQSGNLTPTPTVLNGGRIQNQPPQRSADETAKPSLLKPFADVIGDFRHLPTRRNGEWLVAGLALAAGAHAADRQIADRFGSTSNETFRAGSVVGGTPLEMGTAFATYAIARSTSNERFMSFGSDLIRAQLMAEILTTGLKQGARRARPQGSGFSFPSGHATVTFASATVIQQHFGWKFGLPAYAVATYVAASRVEMRRHYLSDVAFGAALGIVAGRTVTVGREHKFTLTPITATDGSGVGAGLTWVGK